MGFNRVHRVIGAGVPANEAAVYHGGRPEDSYHFRARHTAIRTHQPRRS